MTPKKRIKQIRPGMPLRAEPLEVHHDGEVLASHVFHHTVDNGPRISVKVESNSRGTNYEAGVSNAATVEQAMALLAEARKQLVALTVAPQPEKRSATPITDALREQLDHPRPPLSEDAESPV